MPSTAEEWLNVERGFSRNFPHDVGVIDRKHCPVHSKSGYYNYKRNFNIVCIAFSTQ